MIRIAVNGARGRMGQRIISLASRLAAVKVVCAFEFDEHPDIGKTIDGLFISHNKETIKECDCCIDFSVPKVTLECLNQAVKAKKPMVIGTTGFEQEQLSHFQEAAQYIPIVFSPNMSVGVNVVFRILGEAAGSLHGYRISMEETHHVHKQDAPSGTAKKMAQILNANGFRVRTEEIKSIREGEVVGDHRVLFDSEVDRIEIRHSAKTRDIFAEGALIAAQWVVGKAPGIYSMNDVLFR